MLIFLDIAAKIRRSHKSRFQNKNVECTITTNDRIQFQRFHRIPLEIPSWWGEYDRKRGAHAVLYLPVCGLSTHFARINSNKPPICSESELVGVARCLSNEVGSLVALRSKYKWVSSIRILVSVVRRWFVSKITCDNPGLGKHLSVNIWLLAEVQLHSTTI